ncbi:MAG: hypothetical protein ACKVJA_03285, partial [Flavobacteriales bacterium]
IGSIVTEVDSNNQIVFQLEYANGGNLYRAQKFDWFFYTSTNPILGCTDSLACNYNSSANTDDGSCYYAPNVQINQVSNNLDVVATGGTSGYVYLWSTLEVTQSITPQQNGMYWVIVTDALGCISDTVYFNVSNIPASMNDISSVKKLLKIVNVLGKETPFNKNTTLFYIFNDGTVEKKIIIE